MESKNGVILELALRESISIAKNIQITVELKHKSGEYLIDKFGEVEVLKGEEPNRNLLPMIFRTK